MNFRCFIMIDVHAQLYPLILFPMQVEYDVSSLCSSCKTGLILFLQFFSLPLLIRTVGCSSSSSSEQALFFLSLQIHKSVQVHMGNICFTFHGSLCFFLSLLSSGICFLFVRFRFLLESRMPQPSPPSSIYTLHATLHLSYTKPGILATRSTFSRKYPCQRRRRLY